ncbi:serine hydrolase domain-containing protein [Streptomyces sp. NBC_01750]|uniref:serine hydrolase domain-containing protein n=1 Tax=Streptomyces sp. NBC_01750 TaxID=2975928 RepID=UPI002DD81AD7|nr:serine hydrolase domain-containing protein [Streptomyces sp. NBC_01750]WSD30643.1 beta-lactamase family protein [Streptomyces sp. NBC_01750]
MPPRRPHLHRRIHLHLKGADMSNLRRRPAGPPAVLGRERLLRGGVHRGAAVALLSAGALVLGTIPALGTAGQPGTTRGADGAYAELRGMLADVVAAGAPGVIARTDDGRAVHQAAASVADTATAAKLRPDARFRAGSLTKTFVATVILQLVQAGRLALDEPVGRRLSGLLADGDRITVRQLLNHTSGLFDYTDDPSVPAGQARNQVFTPRELVAVAESHPASFPPGTGRQYSNTNYIVAGLLVEAVTHHPLARELRARIIGPLGLRATSFPIGTGRISGYHAHGYISTDLVPTPDGTPYDVTGFNPSAACAAGALVSNAADLSRFYRALMHGALLSPHMLKEMKTTVAEDPADPNGTRHGLGIERVQGPCGADWDTEARSSATRTWPTGTNGPDGPPSSPARCSPPPRPSRRHWREQPLTSCAGARGSTPPADPGGTPGGHCAPAARRMAETADGPATRRPGWSAPSSG